MTETVRLSSFTRGAIIAAAIDATFAKETERLQRAEGKLARRAYDALIPKAEQRLVDQIPKHWLSFNTQISLNVAGRRISLKFVGDAMPIPNKWSFEFGVIDARNTLATAIDDHLGAKSDLKKRQEEAKGALNAMLSRVTTAKQLLEIWPEGRRFYQSLLEAAPRQLPALRVDEVNAMLGLKKAA